MSQPLGTLLQAFVASSKTPAGRSEDLTKVVHAPYPSNMTVASIPSPYYQHVIARGLPYERGLAHGRQAAQKVRDNVEYYKTPGKLAKL